MLRFRKTYLLILLYLLTSAPPLAAQDGPSPEKKLRHTIREAKSDTARITGLISLGKFFCYFNPHPKGFADSAARIGSLALSQSKAIHDLTKQADSYDLLSRVYEINNNHEAARKFEQLAIDQYKAAGNTDGVGYAYKQLAGYYGYENAGDLEKRIGFTQNALDAYLKSGNKMKQGETYQELGNLHSLSNDQSGAIQFLKSGIAAYQAIGYKKLQGLYYMLNECYNQLGDFKQAVGYGLMALKVADEEHDSTSVVCAIYNHVGNTYKNLGQLEKSQQYFKLGLKSALKNHDQTSYYVVALNLSRVLIPLRREREAIRLLNTVKPGNDFEMAAIWFSGYLFAYTQLKDYSNAAMYFEKLNDALNRVDKMSIVREIASTYMISYLFERKEFTDARAILNELEKIATFHSSKKILISNQHWLFRIDSAQGNYLSAIRRSQLEKKMQDSLLDENKNRNIAQLEIEYESEKKEHELKLKSQNIELLTKQSQLQQASLQQAAMMRNVTIGGIGMLALLLIVSISRFRIKQRNNILLQDQQRVINQKNSSLVRLVSDKDDLLKEKEWLLKEIHHRVKNNLQIVISLLHTQSIYLNNDEALEALQESQHRMHSISLIHQKLYQSDNLARIDMSEYISDLVMYLQQCFNCENRISFLLEIEPISLDVVQAVPIGLILNEAITNAIKYAFAPGTPGEITIYLDEPYRGALSLVISDNGRGLPEDFDIDACSSLGMNLIKGLSKQLHGNFWLTGKYGVTMKIVIENYLSLNESPEHPKITSTGIVFVDDQQCRTIL